jgi:hypothetical protein
MWAVGVARTKGEEWGVAGALLDESAAAWLN